MRPPRTAREQAARDRAAVAAQSRVDARKAAARRRAEVRIARAQTAPKQASEFNAVAAAVVVGSLLAVGLAIVVLWDGNQSMSNITVERPDAPAPTFLAPVIQEAPFEPAIQEAPLQPAIQEALPPPDVSPPSTPPVPLPPPPLTEPVRPLKSGLLTVRLPLNRLQVKENGPRPECPQFATRLNVDGFVIFEMVIEPTGEVSTVTVLGSPPRFGNVLEDPVIHSVGQRRYEPTLRNGRPVRVVAVDTIRFMCS